MFSFGFDTSSEIALLGVSALAKTGTANIPTSEIILLPLLFTAGMTLVDSCDSVFMVHAYTAPDRNGKSQARRWALVERTPPTVNETRATVADLPASAQPTVQLAKFSIVLTALSIIIALLISITEFMG